MTPEVKIIEETEYEVIVEVSIGDKYIRVAVPKDEMKATNGEPFGLNLVTPGHYL
jgi:hypothetical protein